MSHRATDAEIKAYLARELARHTAMLAAAEDKHGREVVKLQRELAALANVHGKAGREALMLLGIAEILKD